MGCEPVPGAVRRSRPSRCIRAREVGADEIVGVRSRRRDRAWRRPAASTLPGTRARTRRRNRSTCRLRSSRRSSRPRSSSSARSEPPRPRLRSPWHASCTVTVVASSRAPRSVDAEHVDEILRELERTGRERARPRSRAVGQQVRVVMAHHCRARTRRRDDRVVRREHVEMMAREPGRGVGLAGA